MAIDELRQIKNTFIVSATIIARAAIRGGMNIDDAFSISDKYIQKCELLFSVDKIQNLQYRMAIDYSTKVEKLNVGEASSKFVKEICNYVQEHFSEPVNIAQMADALFMSRTRMSIKFKEETGQTLTEFIMNRKIDEAKNLLRYTDKTIVAISNYLGFSSQSHFSRAFLKYAGETPIKYRKKVLLSKN